jgi:type II protein arginine methyltransferase
MNDRESFINISKYDFVTTYLTNENLQMRIKDIISKAAEVDGSRPVVDSLSADEVRVFPGHYTTQIIAYTSPWIELDSEDPLVAEVSKSVRSSHLIETKRANARLQVLLHEISYASYCGVSKLVVLGPTRPHNASQFAEVLNNALAISPFMQLLVQLPITEEEHDPKQTNDSDLKGLLSSWDTWNTIRTVCNYNQNLAIGKTISRTIHDDH